MSETKVTTQVDVVRREAPPDMPRGPGRVPPSLWRATTDAQAAQAVALGFGYVFSPDRAVLAARGEAQAIWEISLHAPAEAAALAVTHPDWFVHGARGPSLRFLGPEDATVIWWDEQIDAAQREGVAGLLIRAAHLAPAAVLGALMTAARNRGDCLVIAETFGAAPSQAASLAPLGFDFIACSSCFWNFRDGWVGEEAARLQAVAPLLAFAWAPGAPIAPDAQLRRALRFAAMFAPAWAVDAAALADTDGRLDGELNSLNAWRQTLPGEAAATVISSPHAPLAALARGGVVAVINPVLDAAMLQPAACLLPRLDCGGLRLVATGELFGPADALGLAPGEAAFFAPEPLSQVRLAAPAVPAEAPRLAIETISPQVDEGQYPARRIIGETVMIEADIFGEGHDKISADVLFRAADESATVAYPLAPLGNDRWQATVPLTRLGRHVFKIVAWRDAFAGFADELAKKQAAGQSVSLELREGRALVRAAVAAPEMGPFITALETKDEAALSEILLSDELAAAMRLHAPRPFTATSHDIILDVERQAAAFASWYEIFPRSQSHSMERHGTLRDVIGELPRIAAMGFDVLYFPPIHPIGRKNRKGPNNTLTPGPNDPGSPYAIGSADGGHDALHPELGTLEDFEALVVAAQAHGLELALDFAIQCSPDHPWIKEHKDWFEWREDGSIRYAENPPKKYEDIVNVAFYAPGAKPALWLALRDSVQFWVDRGVRLFRVDNPHTKPFPFWEWMIADIRARHPDTILLAEAFTRPKVMARLAKVGFSQSYTYFTWRNTKAEITEYLTELSTLPVKEFLRPHFFVNTPDINPVFLQTSGRPGHLIRAALAATLSGLWGVYNGFELCEATPLPGKEEYLDSEKYQLRVWDHDRPGNIVAEVTALNRIRRENSALHSHLDVEFLPCPDADVVYFMKRGRDGNALLIAISLDPRAVHETTIELPLWRFGVADDGALAAEDLMRGIAFTWVGKYQPVRFDPAELPFSVWRVHPAA